MSKDMKGWQYRDGIDIFRPADRKSMFGRYLSLYEVASKVIIAAARRNTLVTAAVKAYGGLDVSSMKRFRIWFSKGMTGGSFKYEKALEKTLEGLLKTEDPLGMQSVEYEKLDLYATELKILKTTNVLLEMDDLRKTILKSKIDLKEYWRRTKSSVIAHYGKEWSAEKAAVFLRLYKDVGLVRIPPGFALHEDDDESVSRFVVIGRDILEQMLITKATISTYRANLKIKRMLNKPAGEKAKTESAKIPLGEIMNIDDDAFNPEENPFL